MPYTLLGEPCRNFNFLGMTCIHDPRDGREKAVLSNYVAGGTGNVVLVDPQTGAGETLPLPGDCGAWAVLSNHDERLLLGTCPDFGYLHALDLRTRTWLPPLRTEELYIWNLCFGSDGLVYGGTWPGCALLRYDPARHTLVNLGRMVDDPAIMYSRWVWGQVPGRVLVECGHPTVWIVVYDIATGERSILGERNERVLGFTDELLVTTLGDERRCYDRCTLAPLPAARAGEFSTPALRYGSEYGRYVCLEDGRLFAQRGQSYYLQSKDEAEPPLIPVPAERPATDIITIAVDAAGCVWGASGFGQTIFSYNPADGAVWNSEVVCDCGGEVYGIVPLADKLYLSAYAHGDHIVYDPQQPWDQLHNRNPRTLQSVWPDLVRPSGRSVRGPDGAVYTGWMSRYGTRGGGLSRVDPDTDRMSRWIGLVPDEAVVGMASDDRALYMVTTGRANGLAERSESGHLLVWQPGMGVVDQQPLEGHIGAHGVAAVGGRMVVVVGQELWLYDPAARQWVVRLALPEAFSQMLALSNGCVLVCGQSMAWHLDAEAGALSDQEAIPGPVNSIAQSPTGEIYLAVGTRLYRWTAA